MKKIRSTQKNFSSSLNKLLLQRKKKIQSTSISVTSIIKDIKNNGDIYGEPIITVKGLPIQEHNEFKYSLQHEIIQSSKTFSNFTCK